MEETAVLIRPIISEKSLNQAARGWYTFAVSRRANKPEIKKAVEETFKVKVLAVKTMVVRGKSVRTGKRRTAVKKSDWKKAVVKLPLDQKIELFTVTGGEQKQK